MNGDDISDLSEDEDVNEYDEIENPLPMESEIIDTGLNQR